MKLFEDDKINISKIISVNRYETEEADRGKLFKYCMGASHYELIFVFSGESTVIYGDRQIKDCRNSIRFLPKNVNNGVYNVSVTEPGACIDIYFDTDSPMPNFAIGLQNKEIFADAFLKIYNLWNTRSVDYYEKAMAEFYRLIAKFKRNSLYASSDDFKKIEPSYRYITENFKRHDFDFTEMRTVSGFSDTHFTALFKSCYKTTPVSYVTMLRINYAKELLITGHFTVAEIADMCGFENSYYFSRVFKEKTGVSPSKYAE